MSELTDQQVQEIREKREGATYGEAGFIMFAETAYDHIGLLLADRDALAGRLARVEGALRNMVEHTGEWPYPEPSHEGGCVPGITSCDGICVEIYNTMLHNKAVRDARAALTPTPAAAPDGQEGAG